jgi:hypothetical protein
VTRTPTKSTNFPHKRYCHHHSHIHAHTLVHTHTHTFYRESSLRKKGTLYKRLQHKRHLLHSFSSSFFSLTFHHRLSLWFLNLIKSYNIIVFVLFVIYLRVKARSVPCFPCLRPIPPFDRRFRLSIEDAQETDFNQEYGRVNTNTLTKFYFNIIIGLKYI